MTSSTTRATNAPGAGGLGQLVLCATPIGNIADITQRVLEQLDQADVIYAEDTRVTLKLLSRYGIDTPLQRCDENVTEQKAPQIIERIREGQTVAFVSDAGMPCISDPGQRLVAEVRKAGLPVTVLPGASAVLTAIAGSGFVCRNFYFGGFLPRKNGERARTLQSLSGLDALLVFYESNHRTVGSLKAIAEVFPNRRVCMARELTKMHEEYAIDYPAALAESIEGRQSELKGEVVLVIDAPQRLGNRGGGVGGSDDGSAPVGGEAVLSGEDLQNALVARATELSSQNGMSSSKIAKQLAREFGVSKNVAYDAVLLSKKRTEE